MTQPAPDVIATSPLKLALPLLAALGFVAIALFLPDRAGQAQGWRWLTGLFFAGAAMMFVVLILRPQTLELSPAALIIRGGLKRDAVRIPWDQVDRFFVYRLPRGGKMLGFNYRPGARPDGLVQRMTRNLGADGSLPRFLAGSPEANAERLNRYRDEALKSAPGPA